MNDKPETTNHRLAFLSRVAFICNVCFLIVGLFRYLPAQQPGFMVSNIIILGLAISIPANVVVNFMYALLLFKRRRLRDYVPIWLAISNFLFLILQLYLIL